MGKFEPAAGADMPIVPSGAVIAVPPKPVSTPSAITPARARVEAAVNIFNLQEREILPAIHPDVPVVSISLIRGRATGVGSELALASDIRFASREKAILSQWEVGAALVPGGGPMARLPRLMGRGRALEILLGAEDIDGDLAEKYGYVNRSLPDDQLDGFVDAFATRIATFDRKAIADTKRLVDFASLPSDPEIAAGWDAFITSVQRPQAQAKIKQLMELGLQTNGEIESRLGHYTATLGQD
jgi:enoyl-CoA hydratase/carnithine racemase